MQQSKTLFWHTHCFFCSTVSGLTWFVGWAITGWPGCTITCCIGWFWRITGCWDRARTTLASLDIWERAQILQHQPMIKSFRPSPRIRFESCIHSEKLTSNLPLLSHCSSLRADHERDLFWDLQKFYQGIYSVAMTALRRLWIKNCYWIVAITQTMLYCLIK